MEITRTIESKETFSRRRTLSGIDFLRADVMMKSRYDFTVR